MSETQEINLKRYQVLLGGNATMRGEFSGSFDAHSKAIVHANNCHSGVYWYIWDGVEKTQVSDSDEMA